MRILLRLAEDLHHLVVYELFEQHNHALELRDEKNPTKPQMFRMARLNSSRYSLTKLEEGEGGEMVDVESKHPSFFFNPLITSLLHNLIEISKGRVRNLFFFSNMSQYEIMFFYISKKFTNILLY